MTLDLAEASVLDPAFNACALPAAPNILRFAPPDVYVTAVAADLDGDCRGAAENEVGVAELP